MDREQIVAFYITALFDRDIKQLHFQHTRGELWGQQAPGSPWPSPQVSAPEQWEERASVLLPHRQKALSLNSQFNLSSSLNEEKKQTNCSRGSWVILQLNKVGGTVYFHTFVIRMQVPAVCYINTAERTTLGEAQHTQKTRIHMIASFKRAREKYEHARHFSLFLSRLICCGNRPGALCEGFLLLYQVLDLPFWSS